VPETVLFIPSAEADEPVTVLPGQVTQVCAFNMVGQYINAKTKITDFVNDFFIVRIVIV